MEIFQRALLQRGVEEEDLGKMTQVETGGSMAGPEATKDPEMMGKSRLSQLFFWCVFAPGKSDETTKLE